MPKVMPDPDWGRRHSLQNALYVVPGGAALVSTLLGYTGPVFAAVAVLAAVAVGIAADVWRFRHYSCPQCRRRLPSPQRWWEAKRDPGPISFACVHCDVVWTTRASAGD